MTDKLSIAVLYAATLVLDIQIEFPYENAQSFVTERPPTAAAVPSLSGRGAPSGRGFLNV